ncbi:MAG: saccharopine dehydrogenase NADP-binding domain-containing protein [Ardenticatenales bacterium]|nr:saccharopine dehydrogenase NADP-binding domain-containing protein [Ardenticatenales bacterium]
MNNVIILGAGKIGAMIATLLQNGGPEGPSYNLTIADQSQSALDRLPAGLREKGCTVDVNDGAALSQRLQGHDVVINALPFFLNVQVATAAVAAGCHYLDLSEDVRATQAIKALADGAETALIPQCGLAPGFIAIVANHMASRFDTLQDVQLRVGALPQFPTNALKYNLTWSTDGVVNEYIHPCEAVINGEPVLVNALEGLSEFSLDGVTYECFNTSGGLGSLRETLAGKVQNLDYRTIRYPGHRDIMKMLIRDLRLGERPELLKEILEHAVPATMQDVIVIFVTVTGQKSGRFMQESYSRKVYGREIAGELWSAIQITTASGICAVLDMLCGGELPRQGFVRQEEIPFPKFITNRYGRNYDV